VNRRRRLVLAAAALVAAAIAGGTSLAGRGSSTTPATAPTWDDVAPLFADKCASCHVTGGIAPFSLTSASSAHAHAALILAMTQARLMPPWMPGPDSPPYLNQSQRILTTQELDLIARWVRGGAKLGSGRSFRPPSASTGAGTTLTLTPSHVYRPHAISGGTDDYHCFVLDPHLTQDAFVTSAVVQPQQPAVVHHVILFDATGANVADARQLDAASGGNGWTCFGGPGLSDARASANAAESDSLGAPQWISAWVPGHTTNDLPPGTGVLVHAGDLIVMQVHYNLLHDIAGTKTDRSRVILRTTPAAGSTLTPLDTLLLPAPVELPCPAGVHNRLCSRTAEFDDEVHKYGIAAALIAQGLLYFCHETLAQAQGSTSTCERTVTRPIRIYGVAGHMHLRGVDIRIELNPGTSSAQTLLHIPHWQFHWQDAYYLAQPVDANPGDTLRVTCRFDNSRAKQPIVYGKPMTPRYVLWGEGTTDEMCLGLLQVASR
jgi:hypothetical protein